MKTNLQLVEYAKAQLGRPYWFGTFGSIATEKLLADKAKQYPRSFSEKRQAIAKAKHLGQKVHDCYGLPKGFLMSEDENSPAKYNSKFDISADAAYERATEKGTLNTMPEIPGIILWKKGHVGVYIGNGEEIEARGFDYGVVQDKVSNTKFTHWFKMPEIEYISEKESKPTQDASVPSENAPVSSPTESEEKTYIVRKGDTLSKIGAKFGVAVSDLVKWNKIENPNLILVGQKLIVKDDGKPEIPEEFFKAKVTTKNLPLNIRRGAGTNFPVVGILPKGDIIKIAYETAGWGKLYGREGFVSMAFITKIE